MIHVLTDFGIAPATQQLKLSRRETFAAAAAVAKLPQRPDASVISETIPLFYIGRNKAGLWVAREAQGRSGGLFLFKRSALRFAREECEPAGCAMMFLSEPLELDVANRPARSVAPFVAPRRAPKLAALVAAAAASGCRLVTRLLLAFASERKNREAVEQQLFHGQYKLSSKSDDDLPVVL
jgi:hypothetical protein